MFTRATQAQVNAFILHQRRIMTAVDMIQWMFVEKFGCIYQQLPPHIMSEVTYKNSTIDEREKHGDERKQLDFYHGDELIGSFITDIRMDPEEEIHRGFKVTRFN